MNDVHYYLSGWKPDIPGYHLISGSHFPVVPGTDYILPFGEGTFSIVPKRINDKTFQYIRMKTSGSGETYEHLNVRVNVVEKLVDYGFYSHFQT